MIRKELLQDLQAAIKEEYGQDLELKEVEEIATDFINYFDLLAKIYYRDKQKNNNSANS